LHGAGIEFPIAVGIKVVGCSREYDRYRLIPLGTIDVCGQSRPISHGHHDLLLDYCDFIELEENRFFLRKSWEKSSQKQEEYKEGKNFFHRAY
jgi:hypothetical protein